MTELLVGVDDDGVVEAEVDGEELLVTDAPLVVRLVLWVLVDDDGRLEDEAEADDEDEVSELLVVTNAPLVMSEALGLLV